MSKQEAMTYITRERRAEIRKRIEAATPGPWRWYAGSSGCGDPDPLTLGRDSTRWRKCEYYCFGWPDDDETLRGERGTQNHEHLEFESVLAVDVERDMRDSADFRFIAHARTDLPDLLEAYEDVIKLARTMAHWLELATVNYETILGWQDSAANLRTLISNPLLSEITKEGE